LHEYVAALNRILVARKCEEVACLTVDAVLHFDMAWFGLRVKSRPEVGTRGMDYVLE